MLGLSSLSVFEASWLQVGVFWARFGKVRIFILKGFRCLCSSNLQVFLHPLFQRPQLYAEASSSLKSGGFGHPFCMFSVPNFFTINKFFVFILSNLSSVLKYHLYLNLVRNRLFKLLVWDFKIHTLLTISTFWLFSFSSDVVPSLSYYVFSRGVTCSTKTFCISCFFPL